MAYQIHIIASFVFPFIVGCAFVALLMSAYIEFFYKKRSEQEDAPLVKSERVDAIYIRQDNYNCFKWENKRFIEVDPEFCKPKR